MENVGSSVGLKCWSGTTTSESQ